MTDTNWGLVADKRWNKELDLSKVKDKEDYQRLLKDFLYLQTDKNGRKIGRNIINAKSKPFSSIVNDIWNNSRVLEEHRKRQEVNREIVAELEIIQKGQLAIPKRKITKEVQLRSLRSKRPQNYYITRKDQVLLGKGEVKIRFHPLGYKQYIDVKTGRFTKTKE